MDVALQDVPQHFGIERETEFRWDASDIFQLCDSKLILNGKTVEEIASKDQRIWRCIDSVNPAGRDEERVASF